MTTRKTTRLSPDELGTRLQELKLYCLADGLDDFVARATKQRWSPRVLVEELVRQEVAEHERRSLERRIRSARVGRFKPMTDFDWNWPKKLDREAIERALTGQLVSDRRNMILVGAQGLGKTMIARNITHATVMAGHSALFIEASRMLLDLGAQDSARTLEARLRHYTRPQLLAVDEVGYLSYDARAADLLFEVVTRRYKEERAILMTTNLAFKDWPTVFPNASCLVALIDRLTHHADICLLEGESYRRREAEEERKERKAKAKTKPKK